jgi:sugar/nucleoside kinase (ribokinase family)
MPALFLGEAIVDLICERPVRSLGEADAFVPHFGGAVANAAVQAARRGGEVALAGGAGEDPWGGWLRERLADEGVDLRWFALIEGVRTPLAFVTVAPDGEPDFQIYGEGIAATVGAVAPRLQEAVDASDGLFFSSNTLVGDDERRLTLAARERALERGLPIAFDPNLRLPRWPSVEEAVSASAACLPGALLVRCNRAEAELLTGEADAARAAEALVAAGARAAVVTRGPDGAVLRGPARAEAAGVKARVVNTTGAGDVLTGTLLAALQLAGYDPAALAAALPDAVAESASATERWGAVA